MAQSIKLGQSKLDWSPIDTTAFSGSYAKLWTTYKDAQTSAEEAVREKRHALEAALEAEMRKAGLLEKDQAPRFAYRFGGMAVAVVEKGDEASKPGKLVIGAGNGPQRVSRHVIKR